MRSARLLFMFFIIIMMQQTACVRTQSPLTIATSKWLGYGFISLAEREGQLAGKNIQLVHMNSATEMIEALVDNRVLGATLTLDEVMRARNMGVPLQIVLVFNESAGADVLISRTQITGPEELKGKRIGVEWSAVGALMLSEVLSRSNLAYSDVKLIDIPADRQLDSWNTEKLDAIITYEPMATRLIQNGGYRVFDSKQMPEMIFDVLAIRSDVIEQHADAVRSLSAAHFSMLQRMRINPQDTAYRIASLIELTGEEVMVAFRGIEIPQLSANRQYLEADNKIIKAAVDISLLMSRNNMTNHDDNLFNLVSDDYLPVDN